MNDVCQNVANVIMTCSNFIYIRHLLNVIRCDRYLLKLLKSDKYLVKDGSMLLRYNVAKINTSYIYFSENC